jgi:hypothetical protein
MPAKVVELQINHAHLGGRVMGNLGKVHPILATANRAERATLRVTRELAQRKAEHDPDTLELDDRLALSPSDLQRLIACHCASFRKHDWRELTKLEPVAVPVRTHERERAAKRALATWKPGWYDRTFANEAARRRELNAKVMEASREDEIAFQLAYRAATVHNAEVLAAQQLLALDPQAIKAAVAAKTALAEVTGPMNRFGVALPGGRRVIAFVEALQEGDIPYVRLQGERQPRRHEAIAPAERRKIHLAAVCSAGLRVGAELVAVLPVDSVEVVVTCEPAGAERADPVPVLQMLATVQSLTEQAWTRTDAVSLARALRARLDWSPQVGFSPIELRDLTPVPIPAA